MRKRKRDTEKKRYIERRREKRKEMMRVAVQEDKN